MNKKLKAVLITIAILIVSVISGLGFWFLAENYTNYVLGFLIFGGLVAIIYGIYDIVLYLMD